MEKEEGPRFRGADYGNGKIAVRGGEAMAAKRTTAQGGFAQRNAARDFARQTQKAGPVTGQRGSAAGEMEPNGGKHRFLRSENRDEIEEVRGGEATRVQPATARAGGLPPSNKPCEEVPRPICHGSGKHRVFRGAKTETKLRRCRDQYAMGAANTVFRGAETEMKSRR